MLVVFSSKIVKITPLRKEREASSCTDFFTKLLPFEIKLPIYDANSDDVYLFDIFFSNRLNN